MDKLSKSREEICKDCMFGTVIENCRACLYNTLKMEKNQIDELIKELNELSENEKQNLARMKQIAKVLVDYYLPKRGYKSSDKKG